MVQASSLRQAHRLLIEDGIDLIIATIDFDDSKAIELLRSLRHKGHHKNTPFILYRDAPCILTKEVRAMFSALQKFYSPAVYIEVDDPEGDEEALKQAVYKCLASQLGQQQLPNKSRE